SLGVIALAAGACFLAPPGYRAVKGWRARQLAAQAERFISQNDWTNAKAKAEGAFLLKRTEPAAVCAMARVLTHATNGAALPYSRLLIAVGKATEPDRRASVELALPLGMADVATDEMQKLLAEGPNEPLNLWLAAQFCAALGDYSQTVAFATRAQLHDPTNQ